MIVMKFGGTSVADPEAIEKVAAIVRGEIERRPVVVVSALAGVTDRLLAAAATAAAGDVDATREALAELRARHAATVDGVAPTADRISLRTRISGTLDELAALLDGVAAVRELSPRTRDLVVSFGERLSAPMVAAGLRNAGSSAVDVDARDIVATDGNHSAAAVDLDRTYAQARHVIAPIVARRAVPVVTGFIGRGPDGETTTIGRGGSDYTAAILGAGLAAEEVIIWKEVDGVLTADPRAVEGAVLLPEISYDEAAEMSYFGAKVLHPKTMLPAIARGVPIRIRNTFDPAGPGTKIGPRSAPSPNGVKVVSAIRDLAMVAVEGKGMMGIAGFAAHVFAVAGRAGINILMFMQSSSEQNICLVTARTDGVRFRDALEGELRAELSQGAVDAVRVRDDVAAVAVVGEGMAGRRGVAGRAFTAVADADVNVLAIAQGSSERNISFIVAESDADAAVNAVHDAFRPYRTRTRNAADRAESPSSRR